MIEDALKNAIRSLSSRYGIDTLKLRIKISKPEKKLEYHIMQNDKIVDETNVATALNLTSVTAFMVSTKLNSVFKKLSENNHVPQSNMNIRMYTKSPEDCLPQIYLFDGTTAKRKVALEEIES